ncbi:MAG: GNAT family N-acetyltransferase [Candidatus Limnocylindria bacterium]
MSEVADELVLPDAPPIPGLRFRRYRGPVEHPQMLRVYNAAHEGDGLEDLSTVEQFDLNYSTLVNCDLERDLVLAEVDGEMVAYARVFWTDQVDGSRSYENFGLIHPVWRRRGLGTALHHRNEERLREIAAGHPGVAQQWLSSEGMESAVGNAALLARSGYTPVRYFYEMVAPTLEGIAPPPMPEGIEVRPVSTDHFRAIWDASAEAFRDHWGEPESTEKDWERFRDNPEHVERPFWMIGWEGEKVAGVVTTTVPEEENRERARKRVWVEAVSVRRPWRRRGLAKALLARSLLAARDAGFTSAGLGVDAENPTGALGLYESLGFAAERTGMVYRKPLEL